MNNVRLLRSFVANDWTIENRKIINSLIPKKEVEELANLGSQAGLGMDVVQFSSVKNYIENNPNPIEKLFTMLKTRLGIIKSKIVDKPSQKKRMNYFLYKKDNGGTIVLSNLPEDYVFIKKEMVFIKGEPAHKSRFSIRGDHRIIPATSDHWEEQITKTLRPHYHVDKLYSSEPGYGSRSIKDLVEASLKDAETQGRVTLECSMIDKNRPCPAGFYYKMGFRFPDPEKNVPFEAWLKNGGKIGQVPKDYGYMYLPKENILQCLTYGIK